MLEGEQGKSEAEN